MASRKAYASDWRQFDSWCTKRDVVPLGCGPGVVAAYLSDLAHQRHKASTIARKAAAIGYQHKIAGHEGGGTDLDSPAREFQPHLTAIGDLLVEAQQKLARIHDEAAPPGKP